MMWLLIGTTSTRAVLVIVGSRAFLVKSDAVELSGNVEIKQEISPRPHLVAKLRKLAIVETISSRPKVGAECGGVSIAD